MEELLVFLELLGTAAFAVSGAMTALLLGSTVVMVIRFLAAHFRWSMPPGQGTGRIKKPPFCKRRFFQRIKKSLAEFAARRRQRNIIIFSRDMCVRENTARAASVEFVRHRRTNYARSRPQAFCRKNPEGFSTVSS